MAVDFLSYPRGCFHALLTQATLDFLSYWKILRSFSGHSSKVIDKARFNSREKLLLKIGDNNESPIALAKALWDSDPTNPAYYAEYCAAYISDYAKLPAAFLEHARRIDANNAYFPYWAAAVDTKDAAKPRTLTKAMKASGVTPSWDVANESQVDRALQVLYETRNLPDYRNYEIALLRERIPLLPQNTPQEYYNSVSLFVIATITHHYSRDLPNAIAAKAWLCGEWGDREGLISLKESADIYLRNVCRAEPGAIIQDMILEIAARTILKNLAASAVKLGLTGEAADATSLKRLIEDSDAFVKALTGIEVSNMLQQLFSKVCADGTSKELSAAATKLGLAADAARLTETHRHLEAHKIARDTRQPSPDRTGPETNGALLPSLSLPMIARQIVAPPPLADADVKPGRLADHEMFAGASCIGAWILLMVYTTAMLLMVSLAPVYKAAGQHWFERDTLIRLDPLYPAMTRYEYEASIQLQKELREALEYEQ